jgi:hypothetical protein
VDGKNCKNRVQTIRKFSKEIILRELEIKYGRTGFLSQCDIAYPAGEMIRMKDFLFLDLLFFGY